jgi:hypothetical protein
MQKMKGDLPRKADMSSLFDTPHLFICRIEKRFPSHLNLREHKQNVKLALRHKSWSFSKSSGSDESFYLSRHLRARIHRKEKVPCPAHLVVAILVA